MMMWLLAVAVLVVVNCWAGWRFLCDVRTAVREMEAE